MHQYIIRRVTLLIATVALVTAIPFGIALAGHQFIDVPSSHLFHADIDAIADAGVTAGCGGGRYCPNDFVTRGQMAAFMNRLGALDGQAPKVNADKVDGYDAASLTRVARMEVHEDTMLPQEPEVTFGPALTIVAPTQGFVVLNGSATVQNLNCTDHCLLSGYIRHLQTNGAGGGMRTTIDPVDGSEINLALSYVFEVGPGTNEFEIRLWREWGSTGALWATHGYLTAVFSPFGD